jgi:hypothetical protein
MAHHDIQFMNQASELGSLLLGMGNAADEIAATLRAAGIHGVRNTVRFLNPIVRYCQAHLAGNGYAVDVMQPGVMRIRLPDQLPMEIPLPSPVAQFLDLFNHGAYPDLEL